MVRKPLLLVLGLTSLVYADTGFKSTIVVKETDNAPSCVAGEVKVSPGTLTCSGQVATVTTGGGGSGGSSSLEVLVGATRSSPTATVSFSTNNFIGSLPNATTFQVFLNPATTEFIHNQVTLQSGATAYPSFLYVGSTATVGQSGSTAQALTVNGPTDIVYSASNKVRILNKSGDLRMRATDNTDTVHQEFGLQGIGIRFYGSDDTNPFFKARGEGSNQGIIVRLREDSADPAPGAAFHVSNDARNQTGTDGAIALKGDNEFIQSLGGSARQYYGVQGNATGSGTDATWGAYGVAGNASATGPTNYGLWGSATNGTNNFGLYIDAGQAQINSSMTVTGSGGLLVNGAGGLNTTYGAVLGSATVSNLTAGRCVETAAGGLLTVAGAACGSGSGSAFSLVLTTGGPNADTSVAISSSNSRSEILFDSATTKGLLIGGTYFFMLNNASVTLQGNTNVGLLNATQTWTGGNTWTTPTNSTFTYNLTVGSLTVNGSGAGLVDLLEGSAPSGVTGDDIIWADSGAHWPLFNPNNTSTYSVVGASITPIVNNCVKWLGNNSVGDAGAACGTGAGSGSGYAVEPATVTFDLAKGVTATTGTFSGQLLAQSTFTVSGGSTTIGSPINFPGVSTLTATSVYWDLSTSTMVVSSANVTGQMRVGTLQGAALATCGDSSHALSWTGGSFGCQAITGSPGSAFSLVLTTGGPNADTSVAISSSNSRSEILFDSATTKGLLVGGTYFFSLNPSSVTLQGNTFNGASQLIQADGSGLVAVADLPANIVYTDNQQTISGNKTFTSSVTANTNVEITSNTVLPGATFYQNATTVISTLTLANMTSGSIFFQSVSSITQDNSGLFWDNANRRLGLGSSSPATGLHIVSASNPLSVFDFYGNNASGSVARVRKFRGTPTSPLRANTDDVLGGMNAGGGFAADDVSTASGGGDAGKFRFRAAENFTSSAQGSYFELQTTPIGSLGTASVTRIKVTDSGTVQISSNAVIANTTFYHGVTPSLIAGTNIDSITGTWPNQTINAAASAGSAFSMVVTTGGPNADTSVAISSYNSRTEILFSSAVFTGSMISASTYYADINYSSVTALGAQINLDQTQEVTGTLGVANGGTNLTAAADDNVMVGNGTTWETKALTDCTGAGKAVTYAVSGNTFGCNTITGSGSPFSMVITTGGPNADTSVAISSSNSRSEILFDSATTKGLLTGGTYFFTLDPSSVTLQGNTNVALLNSTQSWTGTNSYTNVTTTQSFTTRVEITTLTVTSSFTVTGISTMVFTANINAGDSTWLKIPTAAAPSLDAQGQVGFDTTDNTLIMHDGTGKNVIGYSTHSVTVTISSGVGWNGLSFPVWRAPTDMAVTITKIMAETLPTGTTVLFQLDETTFGGTGSAGTDVFTLVFSSAHNQGVTTTSFSNPGIAAESSLVFNTPAAGASAGSPSAITFTIYYKRDQE